MKKILLFLLMSITLNSVSGQTFNVPVAGSRQIATNIWITPTNQMLIGNPTLKYKVVTQQRVLDSVANLKLSIADYSLQSETIDFVKRVRAVGNIDEYTISQVDKFIITGKRDGWFVKMKSLSLVVGSNLASSLIRVVGAPLTATNFTESDYTQSKGWFPVNNTTKFIGTGIIPANVGLSNSNFSFGLVVLDDQITNSPAAIFSDNAQSGEGCSQMSISDAAVGFLGISYNIKGGAEIISASFGNPTQSIYVDGVGLYSASQVQTGTLNREISLFKNTCNGTSYVAKSTLGSSFIGEALTDAQNKSISAALRAFEEGIGRKSVSGNLVAFFGDSNTLGYLVANPADKISSKVGKVLGARTVNYGAGGSELRQYSTSLRAFGGYQRYQDLFNLYINTIISNYGTNDSNIGDATANGDATIITDFKNKYYAVINGFLGNNNRVIVGGQPANNVANITKQTAYSDAEAVVAGLNFVPFVDVLHNMLDRTATGALSELNSLYLQGDLLHLNVAALTLIADLYAQAYNGIISRYPKLDFPSTAAGATSSLTVGMPGAKIGNQVVVSPSVPTTGIVYAGYVSAVDVVTVTATDITIGVIDPPAQNIKIQFSFSAN